MRPCLELLRELLGVETVVSTGGGRLSGALLRDNLVNEIDIELLPWAIGGRGTPALFDAPPLTPDEWPTSLELLDPRSAPRRTDPTEVLRRLSTSRELMDRSALGRALGGVWATTRLSLG